MTQTRTGSFPIGFRRGWSDWQQDLAALISFAKGNAFAHVDLGPVAPEEVKRVQAAGLGVGSIDLKDWQGLLSPDAGKRRASVQANGEHIRAMTALGCRVFFIVLIPEDHARPRKENFGFAVDGLSQLASVVAGTGARMAIEGWPGGPPHYSSLACTPADYRAVLDAVPGEFVSINFDPSHLIRMGCDPVRFLGEFAPRVAHVHAKDTEILDDDLYEHGNLQAATNSKPHGFGGHHWRYTLPGHGCARWGKLFSMLQEAGYRGAVSIELEDENFNGTGDGEKRGLIASRDFLVFV